MNLGLNQSINLQQKLTARMIQSVKLLQANTVQLEQLMRAELEVNPILELEDDYDLDADIDTDMNAEAEADARDADNDVAEGDEYLSEITGGDEGIDWEEHLEEGFDLGYSYSEEGDAFEDRYERTPVYTESLEEHLLDQLHEKKAPERIKLLVEYLIGSLDEGGYLRFSADDIMEYTDATVCEVEEALNVLWRLDPPGVGARDLRECLMLQLRARGMEDSAAMAIVRDHFTLFEKHRIPEIARVLKIGAGEVQAAADFIKTLDPKPGRHYGSNKSSVIVPDLIVEKIDGKFMVLLNDRSLPGLRIGKSYADLIKRGSKARRDVKEFVREKFNSANWFIKAIEQRRQTITKVMAAIVERQKIFFEKGPPNLQPLKMDEVAEMIGMSPSSVSRVATGKYAQTPHGIFELRYFFTETIGRYQNQGMNAGGGGEGADAPAGAAEAAQPGGAGGGDGVTAERVKARIRQLINEEDPRKPLTDQKIADILGSESLAVARRTVAKYREQMMIPTVRMRQKYE